MRAVWTAYDDEGGMADVTEQVIELGANEYRRISMPAAWDTGAYSSCVFLWDADTMAPLLPKMEVAKNR